MSGSSASATPSRPRAGKASVGKLPATPAPPGNRCGPIPAATPRTPRHHQLKGTLAFAEHDGKRLACWQIKVTGGGRIWYLLEAHRRTVWITEAGTEHPKRTDYIGRKSDAGSGI